ncbi:histidinol dehydrogenase, chloroplastic-like [Papaver somniferum]|uniref:histidinol dehydrogenase, chloroplastic-like n=1 Tax=Papaver somniferum TaxID=3469 RepID=UPI000E6F4D0A|nr:histidinol dehydrogenase, chloroplastic-like [Papaver somniferum]
MDIQIVSLNQRSSCLIRNPHFSGSFSKYSSIHSLLRFSAIKKNIDTDFPNLNSVFKVFVNLFHWEKLFITSSFCFIDVGKWLILIKGNLTKLSDLSKTEVDSLKARPRIDFFSIFITVQPIVDDVRNRGDAAVTEYTTRFDKVSLDKIIERVADLPDPQLDPAVKEAFDVAYDNIYAFHYAQKAPPEKVENMKGVRCKRVSRCITSVGLYVPGGTAVLPSTALMLAVPAQIAGCKIVVLATPPGKDGSICMEVLYCAKKAGVTHILKARGAQPWRGGLHLVRRWRKFLDLEINMSLLQK